MNPRSAAARRLAVGASALVSLTAFAALADVAPPPGWRRVSYGFRVDNAAAFPGWVILAFPCNGSSGRPYQSGTLISGDALVSPGRRGGGCAMYAMQRGPWEAWRKAHPAPRGYDDDQELAKFVASGGLTRCTGGPRPHHEGRDTDPASITEVVHIAALAPGQCTLTTKLDTTPPPPAPTGAAPTTVDETATPTPSALPTATSTASLKPPTEGAPPAPGCGHCAVGAAGSARFGALAGLLALTAGFVRALRRRSRA